MITTDDDELERLMRSVKNFGTDPSGDHPGFARANATNYQMRDILAAVGVAQMEKRDEIISRRQELAEQYTELLADIDGVRPPHVPDSATHVYQTYRAYIEAGDEKVRDELIDAMAEREIETQIGTFALHRTDAFADAKRVGALENSAALADNLLTLPLAHSMTEDDQRRVVDTLDELVHQLA